MNMIIYSQPYTYEKLASARLGLKYRVGYDSEKDKPYEHREYVVALVFTEEDAQTLCDALNAYEADIRRSR